MLSRSLRIVALTVAALLHGCSEAPRCPPVLAHATRLIVIATANMDTKVATLETYERATPQLPWQRRTGPEPAVAGKSGLGWGLPFREFAAMGEPFKQEGDKRTPAGIYAVGSTFGFGPSDRPGYLELKHDAHVCVDDLASPHYGRIVTREVAGEGTSAEEMAAVPVYKRGLVVDYPASAQEKSGSCIFIHIWEGEGTGTTGCVAAPEAMIASLQDWTIAGGQTAIAILPDSARSRFATCLDLHGPT